MKISTLSRRHTLWVGFVAVLVALLILLGLQYRWISRLGENDEIVHKANLKNFLDAISDNVAMYYQTNAERLLDLPASIFTQNELARAAYQFKKKGTEGVKHLFVMSFLNDDEIGR